MARLRKQIIHRGWFMEVREAPQWVLVAFRGRPGADGGVVSGAGVVALAGASSTPALSSAVVAHLAAGWSRIEGDLFLVDLAAFPTDMPSAAPHAAVQVLVPAPAGSKLAFPAVTSRRRGGGATDGL